MADWSELPRDMLTLITSFLPLADTHRFSSVCKNWCSVTQEKLPWLVLTDDESTGKRRFFNMSENKHCQFDIPELRGAFIVGSSFGWLFAVGPRLDAYLINPFSGAKFALPSLPVYTNRFSPENLVDHVERARNGYPLNECFERVQHMLVMKALLSSDPSSCTNFTVFIVLAGYYRLAFCKSGGTIWRIFDYEDALYDIVFFRGELYALLEDNVLATVDITGRKPRISIHATLRPDYDTVSYLVDYKGTSLLLVFRLQESDKDNDDHLITTAFRVFEIDLKRYKTCELKDIDDHALFLGKNDCIVVRASEFNGYVANSIYFCDASYPYPEIEYGFDDMGVYNLKDGSIGKFYPPEIYHPAQSCPIWMVPNPF